jgi:hypothetical protein
MLTSTKVAISALLLALSASGALAQSQIGNGASAGFAQPTKAYYAVSHHHRAGANQCGNQTHANEVPFAPF